MTGHHLKPKTHNTDILNKSGIYHIKCNDCQLKYVGQTNISFRMRFKEHIQAVRTNISNSKFAKHILDAQHTYDTTEEKMNILHIEKKRAPY
jgi:hypothetical protein